LGVKDWQPSAFSPRTGLIYTPVINVCMDLTDHKQSYIAGTPYDGMEMKRHAGPGGNWGAFIAWDPVKGRTVWSIPEQFMVFSGALATASDLVFYGTVDGWLRAVDARTGKVLWSQKLGSGIISPPMTYTGPDGRQYVAVYAGVGGAPMVEDKQAGFPAHGNTLYVFSLDGVSNSSGAGMITTVAAGADNTRMAGHEAPVSGSAHGY
jgi:alcohol dehydrogenase (cytochrome c)